MGIDRYYLQNKHFALTRVSGEIDNFDFHHQVNDLVRESEGCIRELIDFRLVDNSDKAHDEALNYCNSSKNMRRESLLAVIAPQADFMTYNLARAYLSFAEAHITAVRIFETPEDAISWLCHCDDEKHHLSQFASQHIQF